MYKKIISNSAFIIGALLLGAIIYVVVLNPNSVKRSNEPAEASSSAMLFASTLPDEHNTPQPLKQYLGKTLVVNFWATWCSPCREEMPELSSLHTELASQNIVVLGIAIDSAEQVNAFLKEEPVTYPILLAEDEGMNLGNALGNDKGILPYTVIINSEGQITQRFFGRISKNLLLSYLAQKSITSPN